MAVAADTLGLGGVYFDPVWRVEVVLSPLERALLESRWLRRLALVSHAGAASLTTTQSYSRLEHSLGLLALVAHFEPSNATARATALLHDIGHLPFSHTLEGLAGLNHHVLGHARIRSLEPLLNEHGISVEDVLAIDSGLVPSPLHSAKHGMKLDHFESFVRSGQAQGRTRTTPEVLLTRVRLLEGTIDTDEAIAAELVELVVGEARAQRSAANVVPVAVLRHLAARLLAAFGGLQPAELTEMTDDQLWAALLHDRRTSEYTRQLREAPQSWKVTTGDSTDNGPAATVSHLITRGYLDLPTINGEPVTHATTEDLQRELPLHFTVSPIV